MNVLDEQIDGHIGLGRLRPPPPPAPPAPTRRDGLYVAARETHGGPMVGTVLRLTGAQADRLGDFCYPLDLRALLALDAAPTTTAPVVRRSTRDTR